MTENIYSYFPAYWELFYSFLLSLSSDIMPKLMHSLFLIMSIFLIMDFVKILNREAKPVYGIIAGIIFLSAPTITKIAGWSYLDISFSLYLLLGIYLMIQSHQSGNKTYLYLAAISIGFAAGMKYLGLIWLALSGLLIFEIERSVYKSFKTYVRFILVAILVASPFYIRNYIQTGNPFFPFLSNMFGYKNIEVEKFELIMAYFRSYGQGICFKNLLLLPYRLLFESEFGIPSKFDGKISLLFIPSIIAIIKIRKTIPYKSLLYIPLIYSLIWFLLSQQIRFLIPLLAILSIVTGLYLSHLRLKYLNYILIFAGLLYLYYPLKEYCEIKPYNYIFGRESKSEFIARHIRAYPIIEYVNNSLPQEAKIMLLEMGAVAYLLERELYQESIFEEYSFRRRLKSSRISTNLFFKENSIDFILIDKQFMKRYITPLMDKKELNILEEIYLKDLTLQYRWNNFALYRVNIENGT
ncbi:MAG: glycosyltransferase family 39 protein [Candidatus Kaelpia imicola]|nr:glycosyltransferase family 39 protein [Candidatus Kaelpia imicola]